MGPRAWLAARWAGFVDRLARRRRLEALAGRHETDAAKALLRGEPPASARAHLAAAHTARRAAAALAPLQCQDLLIPGLLLALTGLLAAASLSSSDNRLSLDARASNLQLRLVRPAELGADALPPLASASVGGIAAVYTDATGDRAAAGFTLSDLRAARLTGLELARVATVDLEARSGGLSLFIWGGPVRGTLELRAGILHAEGSAPTGGPLGGGDAPCDAPAAGPCEILRFQGTAPARPGRPIRIDLGFAPGGTAPAPAWHVEGWSVDELRFQREQPPRSGQWVSTLAAAEGKLPETGGGFQLKLGDWLKLEGLSSHHLRLSGTGPEAHLELDGRVDSIAAGPDQDALDDHTPSLLEVLANQHLLKLLWTALMALWGLWAGQKS